MNVPPAAVATSGPKATAGLLVPVQPGGPGWLSPAVSGGMLFFTSTPWLPGIAKIIAEFGHLYMSSANITGGRSATTTAEAALAFGDKLLVLDGDSLRDRSRPHGSTTMVRMSRDGDLTVVRPGINNQAFGEDLTGYATDLAARWERRALSGQARAWSGREPRPRHRGHRAGGRRTSTSSRPSSSIWASTPYSAAWSANTPDSTVS
jgi:hypothetical protein